MMFFREQIELHVAPYMVAAPPNFMGGGAVGGLKISEENNWEGDLSKKLNLEGS